jgi:hypothetical protein
MSNLDRIRNPFLVIPNCNKIGDSKPPISSVIGVSAPDQTGDFDARFSFLVSGLVLSYGEFEQQRFTDTE